MSIVNFEEEKEQLNRISTTLLRRGLTPDLKSEWEVHGQHKNMEYRVYVGYAIPKDEKQKCQVLGCNLLWKQCKKHRNFYCVAIYPKAVYEIEGPDKWSNTCSEKRIFIRK